MVARLRDHEPTTRAVLVHGSYAKGTADADSDLDLYAITRDEPFVPYRMWFDGPLHVSAGAKSVAAWLAARERPARWSLGFPARLDPEYLWSADEDIRRLLGDPPSLLMPGGEPELEDFVEGVLKTRRAARQGDEIGVRWRARATAVLAPTLLRPLNANRIVRNSRDALNAATELAVAPEHYRDDFLVAVGLVDGDLPTATLRLARELLAFLREHAPHVDPQPEIARYLADGTLERLLD